MLEKCFQSENGIMFSCNTSDLKTLNCECHILNQNTRSNNWKFSIPTSRFPYWLDEQGPLNQNARPKSGQELDSLNLRQLHTHCQKMNYIALQCETSLNQYRDFAFCCCRNASDIGQFKFLKFKAVDVWKEFVSTTILPTILTTNSDGSFLSTSITENHILNIPFILVAIFFVIMMFLIVKYRNNLKKKFSMCYNS